MSNSRNLPFRGSDSNSPTPLRIRIVTILRFVAVCLCLLAASVEGAQSGDTYTLDGIRGSLAVAKENIQSLESTLPLLLTFAVLMIVLGLVSAALQGFSYKWVRGATAIVGGLIVALGTVKTTIYRIDYATLDSTLGQVKTLIKFIELDIAEYEKPYIPDNEKEAVWKRMVGRVQRLEESAQTLRDAGQPILPAFIVHAASSQPSQRAQVRVRAITQQGSIVASDAKAGYKYARYDALERLALRASPPPQDTELNPVIAYLSRFAEARQSDCSPTRGRMFLCNVTLSLPALQLNWDVMRQFTAGWGKPPRPPALRGAAVVRLPAQGNTAVRVEGAGRFEMGFVPDSSTNPPSLRLVSIQCADDGNPEPYGTSPWIFEISAGAGATLLPLNDYDDAGRPTLYWVDSSQPHRVKLPVSGSEARLTVIGYRPPAPAASAR